MSIGFSQARVLELGDGVAAAFAARLLGDQGADVIKVEEPEGSGARRRGPFPGDIPDPEKSGLFLALNTNKRGLCFDPDSAGGVARLESLLDRADVLVHDFAPARAKALGLDATSLTARCPQLVTLSITPFGATGPYASYQSQELTMSAGGGWANMCPAATQDPSLPPLKVFGHQCHFMAGVAGATAAIASWRSAQNTGVGEFIDFSVQAYTASVLEGAIPLFTYSGQISDRTTVRPIIPWQIFECRDGPIFLACIEQDQWERLVDLMGRPDWSQLELFEKPLGRAENQDLIHEFLQTWISDWSVADLYHETQKHRICTAPVMSVEGMANSEHLRARDFFTEVEHPVAGRLEHLAGAVLRDGERAPVVRAAPKKGQHAEAEACWPVRESVPAPVSDPALPLDGIRVADLSWAWAGPFCAMNLAHLGAEVVRFESEGRPDLYRRMAIYVPDTPRSLDSSGMFNQWNQGKKSVALNLAEPRAIDLLKRFIATSDVVVENFATGVMERLGLSYDVLCELNPRIILASIAGYGHTGPYQNYMGYGPAIPPLTGISAATGFLGGGPREVGVSMPDPNAGITAAFEVCAALARREETGRGGRIDVSLQEASAVFAMEAWMDYAMNGRIPERIGNRDPWMCPHGIFPCSGDDAWISIACASDDEWRALCEVLGLELRDDSRLGGLAGRRDHESEIEEAVERATRTRERWELTRALQERGVAAFPAMSSKDLAGDAHLHARGFFECLPHPVVGAQTHAGIPYRFSRRPNGVRAAAPKLGADTEGVLSHALGLSSDEIAALREEKVLY